LDDPLPWKPGAVAPFAPLCTPLTVYCCDRKSRAASAQSFTLWQQATIEMTRLDHSIIACSWHAYIGVILRAHAVRGESHIQRNATGEVATILSFSQSTTWK